MWRWVCAVRQNNIMRALRKHKVNRKDGGRMMARKKEAPTRTCAESRCPNVERL